MAYLDAIAFIYPAVYDGPKASSARSLLESIATGDTDGATSVLTVAEVHTLIERETDRETAIAQARRLMELPNLHLLPVDAETLHRALVALESQPDLVPRDAMHFAAMRVAGIDTIHTDDTDFDALPDIERHPLA